MKRITLQLLLILGWTVCGPAASFGQSLSSPMLGVTGGVLEGSTVRLVFSAGDVVAGAFEGETLRLGPGFAPDTTQTDTTQTPTSVYANSELPTSIALHQNYPNPFNPSTTISFDLSQPADVAITVYNYLGMKVWAIEKGTLPAGSHRILFEGAGLASGVYFYRLHVDGTTKAVKKMTLIK